MHKKAGDRPVQTADKAPAFRLGGFVSSLSSSLELLFILFPLFMLVGFQVWMIFLLFRRDSLPLIRSAIFVFSFRAWLDTHGRLPLSLGY